MTRRINRVALIALAACAAPAAPAQAPGQPSAVIEVGCDRDCLIGFARGYVDGPELPIGKRTGRGDHGVPVQHQNVGGCDRLRVLVQHSASQRLR